MAIKSYIKIKPIKDDGPFAGSFDEIRKGINRTGIVVENIANNNVETHKLIQFEKEWLSTTTEKETQVAKEEQKDEEKGFKKWFKGFRNMFRLKNRREQEKKDEAKPAVPGKEPEEKPPNELKTAGMGFLGNFTKLLTSIFKFVMMQVLLNWLSDPQKAKRAGKVFNLVISLGKFALKIATWGIDTLASGIINVFGGFKEGPIKGTLGALFGFLQIFAGFKTLQYLLNPLKIVSDGKKIFGLFKNTSEKEVEWKKQEQWRKFGYKDKETGKIYTEEEYKAQKKSVERQQKKLKAQGKHDQAKKVGAGFNNRVKNPTKLQRGKNIGGKLMKPGAQKGIAAVGGITRIASGIASGEDATQAVGAGVGQAAGGMIGAAAGTALLGPFLGPFAPIVGNAIGGFLGEWVGKTFLPLIKPLFEPIQKMFSMWFGLVKQIAAETGITDFLGTFFKFVGEIAKVLFSIVGWIMKPITWLLGGAIKILGGVIGFVIDFAKKIFAFLATPGKVIRQVIWDRSFKNVGKDVKMEQIESKAAGGELKGTPAIKSFAGGGKFEPAGEEWGENTQELLAQIGPALQEWMDMHNALIDSDPDFYGTHTRIEMDRDGKMPNFGKTISNMGEWAFNESVNTVKANEAMPEEAKKALLKKMNWIRKQTLDNPNFKSDLAFDINKDIPGTAANRLLQEAQKDTKNAAIKAGISPTEVARLWNRQGRAKGGLVKGIFTQPAVPHMSQGGNVASPSSLYAMTESRDAALKQFQYKNQRDTDLEDMVLPPRTVVVNNKVPVINNVATGTNSRAVYTTPSPMFTC